MVRKQGKEKQNLEFFIPLKDLIDINKEIERLKSQVDDMRGRLGAVNKKFGEGPEYLRFSAAHSTIILNNTNISELIKNQSYKRAPQNVSLYSFEDEKNLIWLIKSSFLLMVFLLGSGIIF